MRWFQIGGYAAIPAAFAVHFAAGGQSWEPIATFVLAALGVVPLAHLMGESTEALSARVGPTWGGLLNATFGNAAELIIALIALGKGMTAIVQASLTGSILGNLLLVGGGAMVAGGWRRESQSFNSKAAEANSGMLALAVAAMLFPAIFDMTARQMHDSHLAAHEHAVSIGVSIILLLTYGLGLLFTLRTHAHLFSRPAKEGALDEGTWSVRRSVIWLLVAAAGIGAVAELLVGSAEAVATKLGFSELFVGVILLAIIGNAAEHATALQLALKDDMDTAMTITYQSSLQIALFATPFLVLCSWAMASWGVGESRFMTLIFTPMEVAAVMVTVGIVVVLGMNGKSNWFEGAMLLALYCILGVTFFQLPSRGPGGYDGVEAPGGAAAPAGRVMEGGR